jgi:signal transduction histidine kinase
MRPGTLSRRLFLLTSLWAAVSIALVAFLLSEAYRQNAQRRFAELVTANLYNLMGSVEPGSDGRLSGTPDLGDPRFGSFRSGWYWVVQSVADPSNRLASASLAGGDVPEPQDVAFDDRFQRSWTYADPDGQFLTAVEARVFLGSGNEIYSFRVTGNQGEMAEEIGQFTRTMVLLLSVFGLGFVVASFVIVRIGLRPIEGATQRLGDIRDGKADRLEGDFPSEIRPLIDETNALIESNRSVIERARTQVGNLAHSLKTPLAVLINEAQSAPPALKRIILEQAGLMQHQVQAYLDRARISARHATVTSRTEVVPALDRLVRVMEKLNPAITIERLFERPDLVFSGETQDFEEIAGNLLENAARFARTRIVLSARRIDGAKRPMLRMSVEDDGPGMTPEQAKEALKRGTRLDETKPGSGLGLSIVNDIVKEYGGDLTLEGSDIGGLAAIVLLPAR